MRNLLLLISFFTITPCVLLVAIILLAFHEFTINNHNHFIELPNKQAFTTITYAALPSVESQISGNVGAADTRIDRVKAYFSGYRSPLDIYADSFILMADKYNIDYCLLPAIAMQESAGGQRVVPGTNNAFGWGINSKQTLSFDSYPQAIETVSKMIAKSYYQRGLNTPEKIGPVYNPTNTNDWTGKVEYFMTRCKSIL